MEGQEGQVPPSGGPGSPQESPGARATQGVRSLIGEMSGQFSKEQNQRIDEKVQEVLNHPMPTAGAIDAALGMPDNNEKIFFLAKFSDESVRRKLQNTAHDPESEDIYAGFYMDSLGEMLLREEQKKQEPKA